jgi:type IV secretion system protein VirD4
MNLAAKSWKAVKLMMLMAARDPLWALVSLIVLPLRAWKRVLGSLLLLLLVWSLLWIGGQYLLHLTGIRSQMVRSFINLVIEAVVLLLLFRLVASSLIRHFGNDDSDTHGSARFATKLEVAHLTQDRPGLLIGRDHASGKLLRYSGPAHLLTMAPTRTGKGVGTIIPNLLTAERSVICVDPKGENAVIAGRARAQFGPVYVLDPFGITGQPSSAFNPLDRFDIANPDIADDASALADALVFDEPGLSGEAHWNEEAKALIGGLILALVTMEPKTRRHLGMLREYLTLAPDRFAHLMARMQEMDDANWLIARAANRHLSKSDREAAGVLSTAQRHTHFLDSPRMNAALERSDFEFADLKHRHVSIFLVLPPDRLSTYSRWLRLIIAQSLLDMARDPAKPDVPVLYLLDEFAALGALAPIERAMGLMAGYGVQLWPILQDIHQLRATYGKRAGTFLSNAGVLQVFGVNDHDTARLVSDLLGQETVVFRTMAHALDSDRSGITHSQHHIGRSLLTPDEVRNLPTQAQLLFLAGQRPIMAAKLAFYRDKEFHGLFEG